MPVETLAKFARAESVESKNAKQAAKVRLRLTAQLEACVWATVDLGPEDSVRDFLVDALLGSLVFPMEFEALAVLAAAAGAEPGGGTAAVSENCAAVLRGTLPRRRNGTLLHAAAGEGAVRVLAMAKRVLECGGVDFRAEVNRKDSEGQSPLHLAAEHDQVEAVRWLLEARGDAKARAALRPEWQTVGGGGEVFCKYLRAAVTRDISAELGRARFSYAVKNGEQWTWLGWVCAQEELVGTEEDRTERSNESDSSSSPYRLVGKKLQDRAPDEIAKQQSDKIIDRLEAGGGFHEGMRKLCGRRFFFKEGFKGTIYSGGAAASICYSGEV